jgi:hypothetical protein
LKSLGYADFKDGMHFPDEDLLFQSRIWASPKSRDLFHELEFQTITHLRKNPPKEIIQLRDSKKNGGRKLKYEDDHKTETMRANLNRYNRFIEGHDVEVRLPQDAEVSWQFLESRRGNTQKQAFLLYWEGFLHSFLIGKIAMRCAIWCVQILRSARFLT